MPTASLGAALRTLLALGLPPFASAWISTSQARFGLTIEHIYNESLGQSAGHPQHSLGYLWSQPGSTAEVWGLGGSITWQWDKRLCSRSGLKVEGSRPKLHGSRSRAQVSIAGGSSARACFCVCEAIQKLDNLFRCD